MGKARLLFRVRLAGRRIANALRKALDDVDSVADYDALEHVLADASTAGITIVAGAESAAALPVSFLNRCPARWVLHLNDVHDAALIGVACNLVPAPVPGRIAIAGSGAMSQLVVPRAMPVATRASTTTAAPIAIVASHVDAKQLPASCAVDNATWLSLGIEFTTGEPYLMEIPDGEHVLLVGTARSGRSTGLTRIAAAWSTAHPGGWVGAIVPRRSLFPPHFAARTASDATAIAALLDELTAHLVSAASTSPSPALLVIDDAEAVDDASGRLAGLAARGSGLCIAAAGRPDALRQAYGHWTGVLRRSRLGLVATGGTDLDGDLLSVVLPRRTPVSARPGLWWVADGGSARLLQMGVDVGEVALSQLARAL